MGRREKQKAKIVESEDEAANDSTPFFVASSDDDEANQDLSLKIVERALAKRKLAQNGVISDGVVSVGASSSQQNELAAARNDGALDGTSGVAASEADNVEGKNERRKKSKIRRKKVKKETEPVDQNVVPIPEGQETLETIKDTEQNEPAEAEVEAKAGTVQMGDNLVLRKLLRGPRYFDPPDSGWGTCYNCGEEGHASVNCTAPRRKKPCYVCGSLEHNAKHCTAGRDCFTCKKSGHRSKDCPEKNLSDSKSLKVCLMCGDSGHDMFVCKNDYSPDDLKEIQCYVCKRFGHLCCVNTTESTVREISCYQCGRLGHTGLACQRLQAEANDGATPSSCFKCGEEGHFARECLSSVKAGKKRREVSNTKAPRFQEENNYMGHRSAPHDMGKSRKKRKPFTEERGITTPQKSKYRGGWMTEYPAESSPSKSKRNSWRSPTTPSSKSFKIHSFNSESYTPRYNSSKARKFHDGSPNSRGSSQSYHHRFSASRFANAGGDGYGRSYNCW